jgi:hypothetical protein
MDGGRGRVRGDLGALVASRTAAALRYVRDGHAKANVVVAM